METSRARAESRCDLCNEPPHEDENGSLTCACGTGWARQFGVGGTREEEDLLKFNGFQRATDAEGDVYYVLPEGGHIIHLYASGTWDSDKAAPEWSLQEYFAWLKPRRTALLSDKSQV